MGKSSPSIDESWRVEGDLNTLIEADKIRGDKKRFAKVQALAKQKTMDVAAVATSDADGDKK